MKNIIKSQFLHFDDVSSAIPGTKNSGTSNNGHCWEISVLCVIGGVR